MNRLIKRSNTLKMKPLLILVVLTVTIVSCTNSKGKTSIEEGTVKGEYYTSDEMGWTIEIPNEWKIMKKDQVATSFEAGADAIDKVSDQDFDFSGLKHLINFQKNQFNIFQSTSEKFELEYDGHWEENNSFQKKLLYETYKNQRIKCDTMSSKTKIDGLDFAGFHIHIFDAKGAVLLYQDVYNRYINGCDFTAVLNYNNEEDKEILMNVWKNSKFTKQ